jgi:hypothetical protein
MRDQLAAAAAAACLNRRRRLLFVPLQLLGLQGVQLPTQPVIEEAYADLMNTPLEEGYRCALDSMATTFRNRHCCSDCSLFAGLMYFIHTPLLLRRSELARLGKERLLEGARSRLSEVQGRTALLSPNVQVEPLLLPGAMALLQQVWYSSCCLNDCVLMYSLVVLPQNQHRTPLSIA